MGLSNLPAAAEGLLCILLVNTALTTISIFRRIFRSIPLIPYSSFSTRYSSSTSYSSSFDQVFHSPSNSTTTTTTPYSSSSSSDQYTFIEEFHRRVPAIRFDSISTTINCNSSQQADCTVCLTRFEPDSEVNRLCHCGHIFHKLCLERWLDYWNITCPLCRTPLLLMSSSSSSSSKQLVLHQHDHHHDHVHDLVHEELEDQEEGEAASVLAFGDHILT